MHKAITEISQLVNTPLAIDTSDVKALEAGLKAYPGRALINSASAEPDRLKYFIPLARYGAAILCFSSYYLMKVFLKQLKNVLH